MEPEIDWIKIEFEPFFNAEGMAEVDVCGRRLCVVRKEGEWFACAHKCPHAGGPLVDGYVDGAGNIVCPVHRYKFSLATGRNSSGEGYFLQVYPVQKRADGMYVGVARKKWWL